MNILSLDAVTDHASIAVSIEGRIVYDKLWIAGRSHAVQLPEQLDICIKELGLEMSDLSAVVVGAGPGSYTGIRIGIALAKGVSAATGCPVVTLSTLEEIAFGCACWSGEVCAVMRVGSDRIGYARFEGPWDRWRRLCEDSTASIANPYRPEPGTLVCGPAKNLLGGSHLRYSPDELDIPRAATLLSLVVATDRLSQPSTPVPNYLRASTPEERMAAR